MPSDHSDFWAGVGTIASSIASAYAWLYSIGLVPLFTFITGACFTFWTQERLEKRRRERERDRLMTELVYGPLHKELNSILVNLENFQSPTGASLKGIMEDFRFNLVKEELRRRIKFFEERLEPYRVLSSVARFETESHLMKGGGYEVHFEVWAGGNAIFQIPMIEPIFQDKSPLDFLREKMERYQNVSIIVYVKNKSEGHFSSEHRIHQISTDILLKVREDPRIQEQRREREYLMKECNSLIESIEKEIVL